MCVPQTHTHNRGVGFAVYSRMPHSDKHTHVNTHMMRGKALKRVPSVCGTRDGIIRGRDKACSTSDIINLRQHIIWEDLHFIVF